MNKHELDELRMKLQHAAMNGAEVELEPGEILDLLDGYVDLQTAVEEAREALFKCDDNGQAAYDILESV